MKVMAGTIRKTFLKHLKQFTAAVHARDIERVMINAKAIVRIAEGQQLDWPELLVKIERNTMTDRLNPMVGNKQSIAMGYPKIMKMVKVCIKNDFTWRVNGENLTGKPDIFDNITDSMKLSKKITMKQFKQLVKLYEQSTDGKFGRTKKNKDGGEDDAPLFKKPAKKKSAKRAKAKKKKKED